jgi:hypothetical protein
MKENLNFIGPLYDPRISRIEKIFVKFCPKFLYLYASTYGKLLKVKYTLACFAFFCSLPWLAGDIRVLEKVNFCKQYFWCVF